jgi:Fungal specific transcription factor domain
MGLHLELTSDMIDDKEYEARRCLWLALYRLETLLSEILGRPSAIQFGIVIPQAPSFLPVMDTLSALGDTNTSKRVEEAYSVWMRFVNTDRWAASSFSGPQVPWAHFQGIGNAISPSYLPATLCLSQICAKIATKIFFHQPKQTWYDVQCKIRELEEELQSWTDNLSNELKIENVGRSNLDPRTNLDVAMYFCSVQMLLYRPCLCKIEIENESAGSKEFNTIRARLCVQAALKMMGLFPESPIAAQTCQILPWWSTLHYLCQVGTVLLLELCLEMEHLQDESQKDHLRDALAKVLEYLRVLSPCSKSVYRASQIFRLFIEKVSKLYLISPFGRSPAEPLMPRNWDERDNIEMVAMLNALR